MRFPRLRRRARRLELGALELDVMSLLWTEPALDARTVLERLQGRRITLSTVQATLERLHRKSLVSREKVGRAYRYTPIVTREGLIGLLIEDVAERVADGALEPVISGFVDLLGEYSPRLLDELETSAKRRREKR